MIVGSGGREHALVWRLAQSPAVRTIFASPGNPGTASLGTNLPAPAFVSGHADLAAAHNVDLTVVGPEAPLVAGIVDEFRSRGLRIVGPTQAAARLEGSKIFAKQFFTRAGIPTARYHHATSEREALDVIKYFRTPLVIKADGLAAGKGVVIAANEHEIHEAIGRLGPHLVIEEFLEGEEVSFIGFCDGTTVIPFAPTQDHKRIHDGDAGANTGGMGAYCDNRILTSAQGGEIMDRVMLPAIEQMKKEGTPYTGFLYAGLMMTREGPKVLEFNVRLGDPEAQVLMHSFEGDLAALLTGDLKNPAWPNPSACVVLAAEGYPDQPTTGDTITGVAAAEAEGATVFHAGTKLANGTLTTSGGRVLGVTAGAATLPAALETAYRATAKIHFRGMQYRKDIGRKGLARW